VKNPSFMKCYGVSRNEKGNYILVLKYAALGSLRQNLFELSQMNWKDKLSLLLCIIYDLVAIHSQGIIHRDFHSGNILLDNLHSAYIADFGLSIQYLKQDDEVYGVLPFVAPEVLEKKSYTTASDIYSFGIIMWVVLYGESSTCYFKQNQFLDIVCGMRPKFNEADSNCYIELMKNCWHQDPGSRPTADYLCETFKSWRNDEQIISNLDSFKPNIDSEYFKKLDTIPKCYSKRLNNSIPDELREYLSKNTHIPSENLLNSDQIEDLINIVRKNGDNSSIINTDEIDISKNDNISELYNRFGRRSYDENIIENESIQIKKRKIQ
ncbi:kinase-like domain-containing protein, partial [Gigaspora rosea]